MTAGIQNVRETCVRLDGPVRRPVHNRDHEGHLYGFDQSIFTCVDAETGRRKWKQGRYGFGQVLLAEASSSLIVTCESGDLVLLAADPANHQELGRIPALNGKTWNHPIAVGDRLFVRNGMEAACFELPIATDS